MGTSKIFTRLVAWHAIGVFRLGPNNAHQYCSRHKHSVKVIFCLYKDSNEGSVLKHAFDVRPIEKHNAPWQYDISRRGPMRTRWCQACAEISETIRFPNDPKMSLRICSTQRKYFSASRWNRNDVFHFHKLVYLTSDWVVLFSLPLSFFQRIAFDVTTIYHVMRGRRCNTLVDPRYPIARHLQQVYDAHFHLWRRRWRRASTASYVSHTKYR